MASTDQATNEPLLTGEELAKIFNVNPRTVYYWGVNGKIPRICVPNAERSTIRYRLSDVEAALPE